MFMPPTAPLTYCSNVQSEQKLCVTLWQGRGGKKKKSHQPCITNFKETATLQTLPRGSAANLQSHAKDRSDSAAVYSRYKTTPRSEVLRGGSLKLSANWDKGCPSLVRRRSVITATREPISHMNPPLEAEASRQGKLENYWWSWRFIPVTIALSEEVSKLFTVLCSAGVSDERVIFSFVKSILPY